MGRLAAACTRLRSRVSRSSSGQSLVGDETGQARGDLAQRLVVRVGVGPDKRRRAPSQQLPQQQRGLLVGERRVEQVEHQFGEQGEGLARSSERSK